jgi:uncharacterized membrane protein
VGKPLSFRRPVWASQEACRRLTASFAILLVLVVFTVATASARSADSILGGDSSDSQMLTAPYVVSPATIPSGGALIKGFEGLGLGLVVMIGAVLALTYAILVVVLAIFGRTVPPGPTLITFFVPVLCVIGLGVAGYLAFVETRQVAAVCGPVGDCNTVQSSPYAKLFGWLPVGFLGLLGYLAILGAWVVGRFIRGSLADLATVAMFAFSLFGVLFSIYLTYLELAVILAVCIWCLISAVIMAILLVLTTGPALVHLAPVEEAAS